MTKRPNGSNSQPERSPYAWLVIGRSPPARRARPPRLNTVSGIVDVQYQDTEVTAAGYYALVVRV